MNPQVASLNQDRSKLKHDFLNDIGSLKMNLEALQLMRDEPVEFAELIDLMRGTIQTFQERIEATLMSLPPEA